PMTSTEVEALVPVTRLIPPPIRVEPVYVLVPNRPIPSPAAITPFELKPSVLRSEPLERFPVICRAPHWFWTVPLETRKTCVPPQKPMLVAIELLPELNPAT